VSSSATWPHGITNFLIKLSSSLNRIFRLLIKAAGSGEYFGDYEGVRCKVYFKGLPYQKVNDDRTYLSVETVKMDFSVKDISMSVESDNNNKVIREYFLMSSFQFFFFFFKL
jgi:hypothetical protein